MLALVLRYEASIMTNLKQVERRQNAMRLNTVLGAFTAPTLLAFSLTVSAEAAVKPIVTKGVYQDGLKTATDSDVTAVTQALANNPSRHGSGYRRRTIQRLPQNLSRPQWGRGTSNLSGHIDQGKMSTASFTKGTWSNPEC